MKSREDGGKLQSETGEALAKWPGFPFLLNSPSSIDYSCTARRS